MSMERPHQLATVSTGARASAAEVPCFAPGTQFHVPSVLHASDREVAQNGYDPGLL